MGTCPNGISHIYLDAFLVDRHGIITLFRRAGEESLDDGPDPIDDLIRGGGAGLEGARAIQWNLRAVITDCVSDCRFCHHAAHYG